MLKAFPRPYNHHHCVSPLVLKDTEISQKLIFVNVYKGRPHYTAHHIGLMRQEDVSLLTVSKIKKSED